MRKFVSVARWPLVGVAVAVLGSAAVMLPSALASSGDNLRAKSPSAKSGSLCESDGPEQGDIHRVVLRDRGNRPGVEATFIVKGAKRDARWDYEVSVTVGGHEIVRSGSLRTGGKGNLSFRVVNKTEGRAYAESGLSPHDGSEYCTMGLTATV